jgi:DNA-binding HxlR family transcriptional regulator
MQHKSFGEMRCPVARTLERVGDWWTILILRDAFHGLTRFDEFQKSLDIAPNILSRRLAALVEDGLMERRRYSDHPPREEYVLTEKGRDFRSVVLAMLAWGNRHYAPEGKSVLLIDGETGREVDPVLVSGGAGLEGARKCLARWLISPNRAKRSPCRAAFVSGSAASNCCWPRWRC